MKKKIIFSSLIAVLVSFCLVNVSFNNAYADEDYKVAACLNLSLQQKKTESNPDDHNYNNGADIDYGIEHLCAYNTDLNGVYLETSTLEDYWGDQSWENGRLNFAEFELDKENGKVTVHIKRGKHNNSDPEEDWGECTIETGQNVSELESCVRGKISSHVPDGWELSEQRANTVGENYQNQQEEAQDQIQDIHDENLGTTSYSGEDNPCYESGIDSMGWLVCPTIENSKNTIDFIEGILRDWLQIDPGKVFKEGATDVAWGVFRNIANIIIIIFLLFIIFSQVTGYGIDNYGIKKALPRLIAVAILINFSYILCRLAVDVSNILGVGLSDLFQNIAERININGVAATVATIVDLLLAMLAGAGGTLAAGITIVNTFMGGGGTFLVISLVLVLLVALVAIFMFFVMLAARMLIVILCTIISPVAFACYLLPNTQTFFKKWWDIFKASLVVFPICGALYGGSELIKAIVLSGDVDFFWALIGIVAPFLPFFALPALLKSALAGITAVGGAISAIGSGFRSGLNNANKAIQGTETFKQQQRENDIKRTERSLARLSKPGEGDVTKRELRDDISDRKRHQASILRARLEKYRDEDMNMQQFGDDEKYAQYQAGKQAKLWAQDVSNIESRSRAGQEYMDDGETVVNTFDEKSTGAWHLENLNNVAKADKDIATANTALAQARQRNDKAGIEAAQNSLAQAQARRDAAMKKVEAAQNILTTSQGGRKEVEGNITSMVASGNTSVAQAAATQIMRDHAQTYKAASRGEFAKMANLAQAKDNSDFVAVAQKIANGSYDRTGIDDYSAETLNASDDRTVEALANQMDNLSSEEQEKLKGFARDALYGRNFEGKVSAKKKDAFRRILGEEAENKQGNNNNKGQGGGIIIGTPNDVADLHEKGDIELPGGSSR